MDILILVFAVLSLLVIWLLWRSLRKHRWLAAGGHVFQLAFLLVCIALLLSIGLNLQTYRQLSYEQDIATIEFRRLSPQLYQAKLSMSNGQARLFAVNGDEWQVDARVLKWRPWANVLGLNAQYRLERVSGRYKNVAEEQNKPRSAYQLHDSRGVDLWALANAYPDWMPVVDAIYGSATYLPMDDNVKYAIELTQSGLVARKLTAKTQGWLW